MRASAVTSLHIVKTVNYYRERGAIRRKATRRETYWKNQRAKGSEQRLKRIFSNDETRRSRRYCFTCVHILYYNLIRSSIYKMTELFKKSFSTNLSDDFIKTIAMKY